MPQLLSLVRLINPSLPMHFVRRELLRQHPDWFVGVMSGNISQHRSGNIFQHRGRTGWTYSFTRHADLVSFLQTLVSSRQPRHPRLIMIGADPEWELNNRNGTLIPASRFFNSTSAEIGVDGINTIGEFRPRPGDPNEVTQRIQELITRLFAILRERGVTANLVSGAGNNRIIGGHIHFSGVSSSPLLLHKLDQFITDPLNRHSTPENNQRRIRSGYGVNSSYRTQPHGWEYRSPISWITHPKITKGVLTIAFWLAHQREAILFGLATESQLLEAIPSPEKEVAQEFYAFLNSLTVPIERIEVFAAWGLHSENVPTRRRGRPPGSRNRQRVHLSDDTGMGEIGHILTERNIHTRLNIRIVGASNSREPDALVLYVPGSHIDPVLSASLSLFEEPIGVVNWDRENYGLSYALRMHPMAAAEVIQFLITNLEGSSR